MSKQSLCTVFSVVACWHAQLFAGDYQDSELTVTPHSTSEVRLNIPIKELAARWRLSEQEYTRYLDILNGPLGRWNQNIDPVFALGIFAETHAEQRRYAEMLAQQEHELALRTIEFERAYRRAFQRLYPDAGMIDDRLLEPYYRKHQKFGNRLNKRFSETPQPVFQLGDRILFFVDRDNCRGCIDDLHKLIEVARVSIGVMVDVYVRNAGSNTDVNQWANEYKLDRNLVGNSITLNADDGLYDKLSGGQGMESSSVLLSRGEQLYRIDMQQLRDWSDAK
jgi:integrating conjugative element protein (TIGR03759 family)